MKTYILYTKMLLQFLVPYCSYITSNTQANNLHSGQLETLSITKLNPVPFKLGLVVKMEALYISAQVEGAFIILHYRTCRMPTYWLSPAQNEQTAADRVYAYWPSRGMRRWVGGW